jgi:hypothetical protein
MYYPTKRLLKTLRYHLRRAQAARKWGAANLRTMPAVLGNAMPKSGSHLLIQILEGLTELGPFVNPGFPPVNRWEDNTKLPDAQVLAELRAMRPGDIRYGYLHAEEPWLSTVTGPGRATLFVSRDPRDWVISQIFYAKDMQQGHMLHEYYNALPTMEARINAAIVGVYEDLTGFKNLSGLRAPSVVERYNHYLGWFETPNVRCLRFEDLILNREPTLHKILDYLENYQLPITIPRETAIATLTQSIAPRKSGTFRKGQPGNWREHFTDGNVARFKEVAGELVVKLGYEKDRDW